MRLGDKVAVVIGSARGIGRAIAMCCAAEGDCGVAAEIDGAAAERTAGETAGLEDADSLVGQSLNVDGGNRLD